MKLLKLTFLSVFIVILGSCTTDDTNDLQKTSDNENSFVFVEGIGEVHYHYEFNKEEGIDVRVITDFDLNEKVKDYIESSNYLFTIIDKNGREILTNNPNTEFLVFDENERDQTDSKNIVDTRSINNIYQSSVQLFNHSSFLISGDYLNVYPFEDNRLLRNFSCIEDSDLKNTRTHFGKTGFGDKISSIRLWYLDHLGHSAGVVLYQHDNFRGRAHAFISYFNSGSGYAWLHDPFIAFGDIASSFQAAGSASILWGGGSTAIPEYINCLDYDDFDGK